MKTKWYIGIIVGILAFLGITKEQQTPRPNQEIVLQFSETSLLPANIDAAIVILKQQLQEEGVYHIKVTESNQGTLKVAYYSPVDVATIKNVLLKKIKAELGGTSSNTPLEFPSKEDLVTYNLDIHEIQNANDVDLDLNGIGVFEIKATSDRYFKPKTYVFVYSTYATKVNQLQNVAYKIHKYIAIAIDTTSGNIPEVRAGPYC